MSLPNSRDITLAPGTQLPSTLGNALQDSVIGGRHGAIRRQSPASAGQGSGALVSLLAELDNAQEWDIPLILVVGEVISSVRVHHGALPGGLDLLFRLYRNTTALGSVATVSGGAAEGVASATLGGTFTVVAGEYYSLLCTASGGAGTITLKGIDYEVTL